MGVTRSRNMSVDGIEVSSPVVLKDTNGNSITLANAGTLTHSSLHTSFDAFPKTTYYLELDGKTAAGKDVAIHFDLANKVDYDSADYPILPTGYLAPSVTHQDVGIQVELTQPGQWSAPVTQDEYQSCEREEQQYVCGRHDSCVWETVLVPGNQWVRVTSSYKTDGYTLSLKSSESDMAAATASYSQSYSNIDETPLGPCF